MITEALDFPKYGGYIISDNGACVTHTTTGETVYKNILPDYAPQWMGEYA